MTYENTNWDFEYCVPHITGMYDTRHEAVGMAAIVGREAPGNVGTPLSFTKQVTYLIEDYNPLSRYEHERE